jgi:hypothetical protein
VPKITSGNHALHIAAVNVSVVPTVGFKLLFGLVILPLGRRQLVWTNVTANPTAEWIARQVIEAFPWDQAPRYLIRERDGFFGAVVTRRLQAIGIRGRPITPRSPWQNGYVEHLIGSIRSECLNHVAVLGEAHLRGILTAYAAYYNGLRTHLTHKDAPLRLANRGMNTSWFPTILNQFRPGPLPPFLSFFSWPSIFRNIVRLHLSSKLIADPPVSAT